MSPNAMSLKARIRNMAKDRGISAQALLQNYMFERFLIRLSLSDYRDKFILKGGILIAAIVGLDVRSTMDLDTSIRDMALSEESIRNAVTEISRIDVRDGVSLLVGTIQPIRQDDLYGGYRVSLTAVYNEIETPLSIDVTTGDIITPQPVPFYLNELFDEDKRFELWAYNIETILAEKIETILRRNILNTRPRDFYDVYILSREGAYDLSILHKAISVTAKHRGTASQIKDRVSIVATIETSIELQTMWEKYRKQFSYAEDIEHKDIINALKKLCLK